MNVTDSITSVKYKKNLLINNFLIVFKASLKSLTYKNIMQKKPHFGWTKKSMFYLLNSSERFFTEKLIAYYIMQKFIP